MGRVWQNPRIQGPQPGEMLIFLQPGKVAASSDTPMVVKLIIHLTKSTEFDAQKPTVFTYDEYKWKLCARLTLWACGASGVKNPPANEEDTGSIPGPGRSPGEGNGNPLRYSCLEHSKDRGAWQFTVHGAAKSQTQLSD